MLIPIIINIPIKKLQRKHELLVKEALILFHKNKKICFQKIKKAETIAAKIQNLKQLIPNH